MGGPGVEWVACYESAIDSDARTVLALLEGRGIACRLEPMGSSMFPSMGFAVLVSADQVEAAWELIEGEAPEEPAASGFESAVELPPYRNELRTMDVVRRALRFVGERPTVLLAAIPAFASMVPLLGIARSANAVAEFYANAWLWLLLTAGQAILQGLVILFTHGARDGPPSWTAAARGLGPQIGRLVGCELLLSGHVLIAVLLGFEWPVESAPAVLAASVTAALVVVYLRIRFMFASVSVLVDRAGIVDAFRRSWNAVGTAWRPILGLLLLFALVTAPSEFSDSYALVVEPPLEIVSTVAFVIAYRRLTARATASSGIR